jgi:hypothetical protein
MRTLGSVRPRLRIPAALLLSVAAVASASCGRSAPEYPKVEPVSGSVFVGGIPATGAVVTFHPVDPQGPNKLRPRAVVRADGTFQLTTYTTGDGAAVGEYAVTLSWPEKEDPDQEARGIEPKDRLQNRFKDPKRPFKRITVREGKNELEQFKVS